MITGEIALLLPQQSIWRLEMLGSSDFVFLQDSTIAWGMVERWRGCGNSVNFQQQLGLDSTLSMLLAKINPYELRITMVDLNVQRVCK